MGTLIDFILGHLNDLYALANHSIAVLKALRSRKTAVSVLSLLLVSFGGLTVLYLIRSGRYEAVVASALSVTDGTQSRSALENLLLSSIAEDVVSDLRAENLDSDFQRVWRQLVQAVDDPIGDVSKPISLVPGSTAGGVLTEPSSTHEQNPTGSSAGFLFAPSFLIVPPLTRDKEQKVFEEGRALTICQNRPVVAGSTPTAAGRAGTTATATEASHSGSPVITNADTSNLLDQSSNSDCLDSNLFQQILLTQKTSLAMQSLASIALVSPSGAAGHYLSAVPVQAYIVLSSGIIRVFVHDEPHPTKFFGNQFPPTLFFPSRPYFWPTLVDHPSFFTEIGPHSVTPSTTDLEPTHKDLAAMLLRSGIDIAPGTNIGQFFRVSRPYLDLGGSGIVVTLSRGLVVDGLAVAVICIDLRFDDNNSVLKSLQHTIGGLSATIFQLDCLVGEGSQQLECKDEKSFSPTEDRLFHEVHNEFSRHSFDVLSTMYRFDDRTTIRFSLPLNRRINGDGSQSVTLMLAQFDPTVYKKHNSYIAGSASAAFCALVGYLAYLWGSLEIGWDRYQGYFKGVDAVMEACPTPYTRLDKDDQIIAANQAFRTLLGLTELTRQDKLKEFCADDESRQQYDRVENDRKKRQPVTPYALTLRSRDGNARKVIVHSAAAPSEIRNSLPDTFGIMLDADLTPP